MALIDDRLKTLSDLLEFAIDRKASIELISSIDYRHLDALKDWANQEK